MKPLGSLCTTRFKRGRVTGVVSQQSVLIDGIPRHARDLDPALETGDSATDESDESSGDELLINSAIGPLENVITSDDSAAETVVQVPLRRNTWTKSPPPRIMCDQEIREV